MALRLFNTLTGTVDEFRPATDNTVRMYACGPTVYDFGHVGNFRTFVAIDVLRRFLRRSGFKLLHVMNITDVDDKIIRNAAAAGQSIRDYTQKFEAAFLEDLATLRIEQPEKMVRATEHMPQMATLIQQLEAKGNAYRSPDGSYYFRIASFPEYGKLSKKDFEGIEDGARVDVDEYDKDNARDFALWKAPKPGEAFWDTAIGRGRPGWHIECSAMAMQYLGESFDLHAGGEDLVFPHHENEIAQSEAATGKTFARTWFHVRHLFVEGQKMAKSLGNFYTVRDIVQKLGGRAMPLRYLLASAHYRSPLNFTFAGLEAAASELDRIARLEEKLREPLPGGQHDATAKLASEAVAGMNEALNDDLNTPRAVAAMMDFIRAANTELSAGHVGAGDVDAVERVIAHFDAIFDVRPQAVDATFIAASEAVPAFDEAALQALLSGLDSQKPDDASVRKLVLLRQAARRARRFSSADEVRNALSRAGIELEDTKEGVRWRRK